MARPADNPQPEAIAVEHQAREPRQVAVEDAVMIADRAEHTKVSPWTISMLRLYGCLLIGYLCACMNGYDGSVMGYVFRSANEHNDNCVTAIANIFFLRFSSGINGMDSYLQYFHMSVQSPNLNQKEIFI